MMQLMRTTVTLEPDVESLLARVMKERGISLKTALNEAVRKALSGETPGRFQQRSFRMGQSAEVRWDKALALADALEDEELSRKLLVRK